VGTDYRTLAKVYDNVTPEDQLAAFEAAKRESDKHHEREAGA
jgi:hypothetical protein